MFAATRTPTKKPVMSTSSSKTTNEDAAPSKVRASIDEWETGRISPNPTQSPTSQNLTVTTAVPKPKSSSSNIQIPREPARRKSGETQGNASPKLTYVNRTAEARACLNRAKLHLSGSKNIKTEIKQGVVASLERLYQLVKEGEMSNKEQKTEQGGQGEQRALKPSSSLALPPPEQEELKKRLEEHNKLLRENTESIEALKQKIDSHQRSLERGTYASVVAGGGARLPAQQTALHSVVVTSRDETDSGEEVLQQIRRAVNAKEGGVVVDRIRKARDCKVIIGCRDREEIKKVSERIKSKNDRLNVEEVRNKDPLIVLYGVLQYNTDEDIVKSIRVQNKSLMRGIEAKEDRMEVKYRRKAKNRLMAHIVLRVSPAVWKCLTDAGTVQVDLQRVRVADQSPLIQCSRCLGYGHGRKFCHDAIDLCSHCGGQHLREKCENWLADVPPRCVNCVKTKNDSVEHNAFSNDCPVRRKWEALARSTVAYC